MRNDYEEIRSLIHAYAERIDHGDLEGVADLFAHATIIAGNSMEFSGRDNLLELWKNSVILYEDGRPGVCHLISNISISLESDEAESAVASSYVTVLQALPDLPLQPVAVSRHDDRFLRVDGRWRFSERRDTRMLTGDLRHHMVGAEAPPTDRDPA